MMQLSFVQCCYAICRPEMTIAHHRESGVEQTHPSSRTVANTFLAFFHRVHTARLNVPAKVLLLEVCLLCTRHRMMRCRLDIR